MKKNTWKIIKNFIRDNAIFIVVLAVIIVTIISEPASLRATTCSIF
jgi:hypothetical protein